MSKNRSAAGITNIVQYDANKNITFVSGSATLLTVSSSGALTTTSTITAQTLVVQTITSSVNFVTGSTKFGVISSNTHQFTGSIITSGSVGIGTSSPTKALEILSNTSQDGIKISGASNPRLTIIDTTNSVQFDALTTDTEAVLRTDTNHPLHLSTNGTERMRITSAGNLLMGTSYDRLLLNVGGNIALINSDTYSTSLTRSITYYSSTINYSLQPIANINFLTQGDAVSAMTFTTRSSPADYAERMRITPSGNLLIGTTSVLSVRELANLQVFNSATIRSTNYYDSLPVLVLFSADNTSGGLYVEFTNSVGTRIGSITRNGASNVAYNTSSDIRLKKNIINAPLSGVNKINSIQVRSFDWIADDIHQDFGFIAQELINTAPEAVTKGIKEEDIWQVDNSKLIPALVKSIQELNTKFEEYKATHP
jgi:hypothetical protein